MREKTEPEQLLEWKKIHSFDTWALYIKYLIHLYDVLHNEMRMTRGAKTIKHINEKGIEKSRTVQSFEEQIARLQGELDGISKVINYHKQIGKKLTY